MLTHKLPDGSESPVGYVSRTVNDAERNYAQLEKEGLVLVFSMKKILLLLIWACFHLDYAGPVEGKMVLVLYI